MNVYNHILSVLTAPSTPPRDLTPVRQEEMPDAVTLNWQPPQKPNCLITGVYQSYKYIKSFVWHSLKQPIKSVFCTFSSKIYVSDQPP